MPTVNRRHLIFRGVEGLASAVYALTDFDELEYIYLASSDWEEDMSGKGPYYVRYTLSGWDRLAVDRLRWKVAFKSRVFVGLNSIPHITFRYFFDLAEESGVRLALSNLADQTVPFTVPIIGFGSFGESTWFIDPAQDRRLFSLKERTDRVLDGILGAKEENDWEGTHFHVTLFNRLRTPAEHRMIGSLLRRERPPIARLTVDSLTLCRNNWHDLYNSTCTFPFRGR